MKSETYQKLGPFEDQLFIDGVDTENALRMRAAGYRIVEFAMRFWSIPSGR